MKLERIEELRAKVGGILHLAALDGRNDDVTDLVDILGIMSAPPRVSVTKEFVRELAEETDTFEIGEMLNEVGIEVKP